MAGTNCWDFFDPLLWAHNHPKGKPIFTDFLHMFTFLKLEIRLAQIFFGKSYFFPKILNFFCIGLPPAETYWMIMSPQKRVKKSQQFVPAKHSYIM